MLFEDPRDWLDAARQGGVDAPACPRGAFLVAPDALAWAADSAGDNRYMQAGSAIDLGRAQAQHRALQQALSEDLPVIAFPGRPGQFDGVFCNNAFATAQVAGERRFLLGRMRHPHRQAETDREDVRRWFLELMGCRLWDLRDGPGLAELTGTLVIDRARAVGVAGLGPRCDRAGAEAMAAAFGLRACLLTPLAEGEYHANVVLALCAGRLALVAADAWQRGDALCAALAGLYGKTAVIELDREERESFAGNSIALREDRIWMSERAADSLRTGTRSRIEALGFRIGSVALDEIEKAGGSLRCCVGEIF